MTGQPPVTVAKTQIDTDADLDTDTGINTDTDINTGIDIDQPRPARRCDR
ncbi:hypothetical protein [Streptomyces sp. FL07-04A]|nr:hypothetical protein [Streptomyces sp. FL07-04A]MDX3576316.1 hypothetical protein [Streptomyces sp. FL07-04A]